MRLVVKFEGHEVGMIAPASFDHFEVFGPWRAWQGEAVSRFSDMIEEGAQPQVELVSATGHIRDGYVTLLEDNEITVKCVPEER